MLPQKVESENKNSYQDSQNKKTIFIKEFNLMYLGELSNERLNGYGVLYEVDKGP